MHPPGPTARYPFDLLLRMRMRTLPFLTEIAHRYGDVASFPVGQWRYYLLSHPEAIREVLVTKAEHFIKGPALRRAKVTLGEGLLTSEDPLHKRQRRLMQPAFHATRVAAYAETITDLTHRTASRWQPGQTIDAHHEMTRLTLEVAAKAMFGAELSSEIDDIGAAMTTSVRMFMRALLPFGQVLNRLPLPSNVRFRRDWSKLERLIERFIAERRANPTADRRDLLAILLAARDEESADGAGMSDRQLRDESVTLFTAGHETTANALTFSLHLLAHHPESQTKLRAELTEVLAGRTPTADDAGRLPYTRACFAEAMRLYPPAWAVGREVQTPVTVHGHEMPAGAIALMSQWVMHRHAKYWPEPEQYRPERWLDPDPDRPRFAYFPFGSGPRSCIGESFAWLEGILALATLLQRWRFDPTTPTPDLPLQPTITLRPRDPVRLAVHPVQMN